MSERRHPNVVNLSEVEPMAMSQGTRFGCLARRLTGAVGAAQLGASYYEVEPGKTAFPAHFHCANEESMFIVEGEGTLRVGDMRVPVRAGDYIAVPTGPAHAHQLLNTGTTTLKYLCFSTLHTTEVVGYPDSKKFGFSSVPSVAEIGKPWVRQLAHQSNAVAYYDGEDTGESK